MMKIMKYGQVKNEEIFARSTAEADVSAPVREILENVRTNGDKALYEYAEKFDKVKLDSLVVSPEEMQEALDATDPAFLAILERAAANIRKFHQCQKRSTFVLNENGVMMGQKIIPVDRAGLYVPGGKAVYPSTVLMDSIPAKIAGCKEVVITTPPAKDGKVNPSILAAAHVAGVDRIFKVGGAQAIGALAYGTETIPKVDKIVGPGNVFVAEAKKQVYGLVSIDMIAGPSEIMVIADQNSDPDIVAADLLSQAEHDQNASAVLVTNCENLASAVQQAVEQQLIELPREAIARASIENNGKIIITETIEQAVYIANEIAPEHLELCVDEPFQWLDKVRHAGSIFLGRNCPESLGDYMAGVNHTLPTSGTARFSSPLSVDDFIKKTQFTYFTEEAFADLADDVAGFAMKEGLDGHARAALIRRR